MNTPLLISIHFFLILLGLCNTQIKIPFESKLCLANQNDDFLSNYYGQYLYTSIKIGSNNQRLEVALKLNRYVTYLISSDISDLKSEKFNEKDSNTYEVVNKKKITSNEDEFFSSVKSTDNIIFGENINYAKYIFYLSKEQYFDETGHIGLKIVQSHLDTDFKGNGFIDQLKSNSLINSHSFYFKYEYKDEKEFKYKGNLIIGGMPHEIEPSELYNLENYVQTYVEVNKYNTRWSIEISSVNYGNDVITQSDTIEFSTTFGFIEAPIKFIFIFDYFFNQTGCGADHNGENKNYLYLYCDESVDISKFKNLLFIGRNEEFNFTLTYKDLFRKIKNYNYFLILFNEDVKKWIFGHIFLKKYTIVFNPDKKSIGYYYQPNSENYNNNTSKSFTINLFKSLSVVLGLVIIGLLVYINYFNKRKRKIRPNELEENFDYTSTGADKEQENKLGV